MGWGKDVAEVCISVYSYFWLTAIRTIYHFELFAKATHEDVSRFDYACSRTGTSHHI